MKTTFNITEINLRRKLRGAEHIRVDEYVDGVRGAWYWIDSQDIKEMKKEYGENCFLNICENDNAPKTRIKLEYKVPMFRDKEFDIEKRLIQEKEDFNNAYPDIDLMDLYEEGTEVELGGSFGTKTIEFTLTKAIEIKLLSNHKIRDLLEKVAVEKLSDDILNINDTKIDIDSIGKNIGTTAFLEGDFNLNTYYDSLIKVFTLHQGSYLTIADLYKYPEKLALLKKYDVENLVVSTTGINPKLKELIQYFEKMSYKPLKLIFINSSEVYRYKSVAGLEDCEIIDLKLKG